IFDENPFGRRAVPLAYALVCLHPTFYLLAGSLNNDCLMVLLFFTAVLYTLRWYRDPSLKRSCVMYDELTEVDIKKMQEEINYRTRVLRPQLIEEVQTARAFGDLSENYEYKCAKQAKNRNDSRIRYLERMIRTAKVIEVKDQGDRAGLFDKVTIYNELAKQEMTLQIVTTLRQDALKGLISKESPVGKALLGRQVGDRIQVEVSPEVKYWVEIRAIEKGRDDESLEISSY
ncbi:MAG: GreA/GreB family elongation factor, partial [Dysosmobacter welbionis]